MSLRYTLRATVLTGLIIIGSSVQSGAGAQELSFVMMAHSVLQESVAILQTVVQRGLDGMAIVIRGPWGAP